MSEISFQVLENQSEGSRYSKNLEKCHIYLYCVTNGSLRMTLSTQYNGALCPTLLASRLSSSSLLDKRWESQKSAVAAFSFYCFCLETTT
ncbi:hypothetical protein CDAR_31141 [Caerostris darwini]|uniref:Uncharacterized protein n=1 Tax=Caerostris darwini TaxID=1538125 RepID=A0AAV4RVT7_9ARAC|nr:hypothetical protein CDAR_31141 [Caerostris darwini]